ncbi:MAG: dockerin type I domain-containing protein [Saprospiraceae bacterium]
MRTYFYFLIPKTDGSARLSMRCALLLFVISMCFNPNITAQKCVGGLDSIQQVSVSLDCAGDVCISWDAHPDKCYTFSIPGVITRYGLTKGKVTLTGSGVGIVTGAVFYLNEVCSKSSSTNPCQGTSGSATSVDIYSGVLPDVTSVGTWNYASSGSSINTKDTATVFDANSPTDLPMLISDASLSAATSSIIRPSGSTTTDARYCITAKFKQAIIDSVFLIGENVTGFISSGLLLSSIENFTFCLDQPGIAAGTHSNSVVFFNGRCKDTIEVNTVIGAGSDEPTMACHGNLQISITNSGFAITPAMMLPGQSVINKKSYIEGTNSNIVDCSHVGMTINIVVEDTIFNQKCWGSVMVKDRSVVTAIARDTMISCLTSMDSLSAEKLLMVNESCTKIADLDISFADVKSPGDCNSGDTLKYIQRTWIIRSPNGKVVNAVSNIVIKMVPFDTIVFPGDTTIYCPDTSFMTSNTGGLNIDLDSLVTYCKIQVGFSDRIIPTGCSGMKKVERTWLAIDWCNNITIDTVQYITLLDTLPPVISCPTGDVNNINKILTTLDTCGAYFVFPSVTVTDSCSDDSKIAIDIKFNGALVLNKDSVFMPVGENYVEYIATDDCGNAASCIDTITIQDNTVPQMNGPTIIQVSHTGTGNTLIPIALIAKAFDISDNCGMDSMFIRRIGTRCGIPSDTIFGNSINICCADSDTLVPIEILAKDKNGLTNTILTVIDVKDSTPPVIVCKDTTVFLPASGELLTTDSTLFFTNVTDNCGFDVNISLSRDTFLRADTNAVVSLVVTASDIDGSTAQCVSMVTVKDTFSISGVNFLVGLVSDPFDVGLGGIDITLLKNNIKIGTTATNAIGFFNLLEEILTDGYSMKLKGYGEEMNGVSSLDLYLIQKHILGLQKLNNPYLELAADVNQSGAVSALDLLSLQNTILGLPNHSELPWLFLKENKIANGLVYTSSEIIPITPSEVVFRAVKMGDVSGDIYNEASGRSNANVDLLVESINLEKGKMYSLPISFLPHDGMVSFHISLIGNNIENFNFVKGISNKNISIEWYKDGDQINIIGFGDFENENRIKFGSLNFVASSNGLSNNVITIMNNSEVYSQYQQKSSVDLAWYNKENPDFNQDGKIVEIFPNPAVDQVNFEMYEEPKNIISFKIVDITGKIILNLTDFKNNNFSIPTSIFPSSGSYIVNIESLKGIQNDILLINKK